MTERYLKADHLLHVDTTITSVSAEDVYGVARIVLYVECFELGIVLMQHNLGPIIDAFGDAPRAWIGAKVCIRSVRATTRGARLLVVRAIHTALSNPITAAPDLPFPANVESVA